MAVKKRVLIMVIVCALSLAVGVGPGAANPARALPGSSAEQAGTTIPYAGRLSDDTGQSVADGAYDLAFTLYNTITGGEPLWSEVQMDVTVSRGEFRTTLGSVAPIPAAALGGRTGWLAVGVRGPGEARFTALSPRQLVSVAAPAAPTAGAACPHDHLGEVWIGDSGAPIDGLFVQNTKAGGTGIAGKSDTGDGVVGVSGDANKSGVYGNNTGGGYGVYGRSDTGTGVGAHSTNGPGLFAHSDNSHSIYVDGSGGAGVYVESAGANAVYVLSAAFAGVVVYSAGMQGMWVHSAARDGILVETAGWDGVHVVGPVGGVYYGSGTKGDEDFAVLNTGEVRSKVGFAAPANDFAITMPVAGKKTDYESGDVLVASASGSGAAERTSVAYSPAVIGVYSATPAFVGGRSVTGEAQAGGLPIAILGVVACKVSAENGPIRPGDLLVTSATPGHAMRADDSAPRGTILGKALEALDSGTGLIQVLVTLQ